MALQIDMDEWLRFSELMPLEEVADKLDGDAFTVQRRIESRSLPCVTDDLGKPRVPRWAIELPAPTITALLDVCPDDMTLLHHFMTTPSGALGGSPPYELLMHEEAVSEHARSRRRELLASRPSFADEGFGTFVLSFLKSEVERGD